MRRWGKGVEGRAAASPASGPTFWIAGAAIFLAAALALQKLEPLEVWKSLTAGIWMIAAPRLLGYTKETDFLQNSIVGGLIVTTLSVKSLRIALRMQKKQFNGL
jgi:hypothetical protein